MKSVVFALLSVTMISPIRKNSSSYLLFIFTFLYLCIRFLISLENIYFQLVIFKVLLHDTHLTLFLDESFEVVLSPFLQGSGNDLARITQTQSHRARVHSAVGMQHYYLRPSFLTPKFYTLNTLYSLYNVME